MRGLILPTATTYLMPVLLVFSVFLLLRGHNEPGGGFSGALVAAAAFVLLSIADGVDVAAAGLDNGFASFIAADGEGVNLTFATLATPVAGKTLTIAIFYSHNA